MLFNNVEIFIEQLPSFDRLVKVYIIEKVNGNIYNHTISSEGIMKYEEVKEGAHDKTLTPFMVVPEHLLQKIVDAFSEKVPPTKKERIEAELEATKYHLEDMRTLVLKKNK